MGAEAGTADTKRSGQGSGAPPTGAVDQVAPGRTPGVRIPTPPPAGAIDQGDTMIMHFPTVVTGTPVGEPFKLEMHICDQRRSFFITFHRECDVIGYIRRHREANEALTNAGVYGGGYAWFTVEDSPVPNQWEALDRLLFPTCEHGMSADLCYGPAHYATDEEIAQGW